MPDTRAGDFSDVLVKTPEGDIPWNTLSRINQNEMKALMIEAVNKTYSFLRFYAALLERTRALLFTDSGGDSLTSMLEKIDLVSQWNEPEFCITEKEGDAMVRLMRRRQTSPAPKKHQLRRKRKTRNSKDLSG